MSYQAYVSDAIIVNASSQGVTGWAAIITDLGSAGSTAINDLTPTTIGFATAFSPDYNSTVKVGSIGLFLTQAGAAAYLTLHPGSLTTYGYYKPADRN